MTNRSGEAPQAGAEFFNTPIHECVAVVVDPNHPRFGEVADISWHDWREYGNVGVRYGDDQTDTLKDGILSTDTELPQVRILRRDDEAAINDLLAELPQIKDSLQDVTRTNHKRINPQESRVSAKVAFKSLISGEGSVQTSFEL